MTFERNLEETKIKKTLNIDKPLSQQTPIGSLFSGINLEGKEMAAHSLFLETPSLENFSRYSAIIRDYFFHLEKNHKQFALLLGKIFNDERSENLTNLIADIEENKYKTPTEISMALSDAMVGETNSKTRNLIASLKKLYDLNNATLEEFKKEYRKQNEIYEFIDVAKDGFNLNKEATDEIKKIFKLDKEADYRDFTRIEKELESFIAGDMVTSKAVRNLMEYTKQNSPEKFDALSQMKIVEIEYHKLKKLNSIERLTNIHEKSALASRIFMIKTFQSGKNAKMLGSLFYQDGIDNDEVQRNKKEVEKLIFESATSLKVSNPSVAYMFTPEVIKSITEEITQKYVEAKEKKDRDVINSIDAEINTISMKTKASPDIVIEEKFMKIVEDTVYNVMMSEDKYFSGISGLSAYNELAQDYNRETDLLQLKRKRFDFKAKAIDIEKNVMNGLYETPTNGGAKFKLAKNALTLWNIRGIAKSIGDGTITKEEAKIAIEKTIKPDTLNKDEKEAFTDNIMKNFDHKERLKSLEIQQDIDKKTGDTLALYEAKKLYAGLYGDNLFKFEDKRLLSKTSLELQTCIESASSPKINSHSASSEVTKCFDDFKRKVEGDIKEMQQLANQPMAALTGLSILSVLLSGYQKGKLQFTSQQLFRMEQDRINAIGFVNKADNPKDKHFRSNIIKNDKLYMSSEIVDKTDLDEWVFRTLLAKHEFEIHSDTELNRIVNSFRHSPNTLEQMETFRESFKSILGNGMVRSEFNSFALDFQEDLRKDFLKHKEEFVTQRRLFLNAVDSQEAKEIEKTKGSFSKFIKEFTKSYQLGSISLKEAKDELLSLNEHTKTSIKILNKRIAQTKKDIEEEFKFLSTIQESPITRVADMNKKEHAEKNLKNSKEKLEALVSALKELEQNSLSLEEVSLDFASKKDLIEKEDIFSQLNAFGDDPEKSLEALSARYSNPKMIEDTAAQDLLLLEKFQEHLENSKEKISNKELASVNSLKILVRETYILNKKKMTNGKLSNEEILRGLYEEKKEIFTRSGELDFTVIKQTDKSKVQVLYREKAGGNKPRKQIEESIEESLSIIKQANSNSVFNDDIKGRTLSKVSPEELNKKLQEAYENIKKATGLDASPSAHKDGRSEDSNISERTSKNINNDESNLNYIKRI